MPGDPPSAALWFFRLAPERRLDPV